MVSLTTPALLFRAGSICVCIRGSVGWLFSFWGEGDSFAKETVSRFYTSRDWVSVLYCSFTEFCTYATLAVNRDYSYPKLTGLCKGKLCWRIPLYRQKCRNLNANLLLTKCQHKSNTFWLRLITFKRSDDDISLSCLSQLRDSNIQAFIYRAVFISRISQSRRELFRVSQVTICLNLFFFLP